MTAGIFQFTGLKRACLEHCRTPFGYLLARWDDRPREPFHLGLGHGLFCLGCCWALMALCFAVGVMNLAWMAVLALASALEQLAPRGERLARGIGALLIVGGLWLLAVSGWPFVLRFTDASLQ
jgi:predicted metal-binding membrane protein